MQVGHRSRRESRQLETSRSILNIMHCVWSPCILHSLGITELQAPFCIVRSIDLVTDAHTCLMWVLKALQGVSLE